MLHSNFFTVEGFGSPYRSDSGSGQDVAALFDDAIGINASQTDCSTAFDHCSSFHDLLNGNAAFAENESHDGGLENPKSFVVASALEAPSLPEEIARCKFWDLHLNMLLAV